ncbi:unnamed protein product [Clavelina lepadiformis]|uniref:Folate receptor-like domain-containing protein n=1 Tax=Clavelina lepadiformis TaxID=159417 RepID=A0ABP0FM40_CLALP
MYVKVLLFFFSVFNAAVLADEEVLNMCLDAKYHKSEPGPENGLFAECSPWKDRSCCTNETAYWSHQSGPGALYDFNYNHCGTLSEKCRRHFNHNNCFYECSPNVGAWIVEEPISHRNERFKNVPICESSCTAWYDDCQNDLTCKDNWAVGWDWTSETNECPQGAECKSFTNFFHNATHLCESIFPEDYQVVSDDSEDPCMVLWFDTDNNPNDDVNFFECSFV